MMESIRSRAARLAAFLCAALACAPSFAATTRASFQVGMIIRDSCRIDGNRAGARPATAAPAIACSRAVPYRIEINRHGDVAQPRSVSLDPAPADGIPVYTVTF